MTQKVIVIKDKEIPIEIKSYKTSKSIKILFKGNTLVITKPKYISIKTALEILKQSEEEIYNKYMKIQNSEIVTIKQWKTGEKIFYCGKEFEINRKTHNTKTIQINLSLQNKKMEIIIPEDLTPEEIKVNVDKAIKKLFKNNTEALISKKLPYWSRVTGFDYNQVKVRDATTKFGSCMPSKKNLYFSSRLIMLPEDKVDAVIVHELCHMKYKYHNSDFYNLVETYIPNYKEIDSWLNKNGKIIMF